MNVEKKLRSALIWEYNIKLNDHVFIRVSCTILIQVEL